MIKQKNELSIKYYQMVLVVVSAGCGFTDGGGLDGNTVIYWCLW